jgi:hypothetical protein
MKTDALHEETRFCRNLEGKTANIVEAKNAGSTSRRL